MSFTTFYTKKSTIYESCLWIIDGSRYICLTYVYYIGTGELQYAASILKTNGDEPTVEQYANHEFTTTRRYEIRPIQTNIAEFLTYPDLLKAIRREMCHGHGCAGIRRPIERFDTESLSSVEMYSEASDMSYTYDLEKPYKVSPRTFTLKQINQYCINIFCEEPHGNSPYTLRQIFMCFKGLAQNGDLLYGACVFHSPAYSKEEYAYPIVDEDVHYETALMRLEKCPVHMNVSKEFRHQLKKKAIHQEDIITLISDKIQTRVNGHIQTRGSKLNHWLE